MSAQIGIIFFVLYFAFSTSFACSLASDSSWFLSEAAFYKKTKAILVVRAISVPEGKTLHGETVRSKISFSVIKVLKGVHSSKDFEMVVAYNSKYVEGIPLLWKNCDIGLKLRKNGVYILTPDSINPSMIREYSEKEEKRILDLAGK